MIAGGRAVSLADQAQRAFETLRELGSDHAERDELRAAGIAEARIEALYGREFAALLPSLCAHISDVADDELLPAGGLEIRGGATWPPAWNDMPEAWYEAAEDAFETDKESISGLSYHISDRIEALGDAAPLYRSDVTALQLANAIWSAWWLMTNRARYPSERVREVDELMVGVARGFALRGGVLG